MSRTRLSWSRFRAVLIKEFIQMRRDRLTFAMMIGVPLLQLTLFGYAINTDPSGCRPRCWSPTRASSRAVWSGRWRIPATSR